MRSYSKTTLILLAALSFLPSTPLLAQTAASRLQPLGAPSAVDQYRQRTANSNETAFWQSGNGVASESGSVQQTALLQSGGFGLPSGDFPPATPPPASPAPAATAAPPAATNSVTLPTTQPYPVGGPPTTTAPRALPSPSTGNSILSPSDLAPMQQPSLTNNAFATVDNCHLVTGPQVYNASMDCGCGTIAPTTYASDTGPPITTPSGTVVSPTTLPAQIPSTATTLPPTIIVPQTAPQPTAPPKTAPRALVSLGQTRYPVQVGQGLWGQPVAYVPGQGFRNWFRYLFP